MPGLKRAILQASIIQLHSKRAEEIEHISSTLRSS